MPPEEGDDMEVGAVYVRWGKRVCPSNGAVLLYHGYAAGGPNNNLGNGANFLCAPSNPQYLSDVAIKETSHLYGAEFITGTNIFIGKTDTHNVPCAVCHAQRRSSLVMVPGKTSCPDDWTREYYGYLMASEVTSLQNMKYECVDSLPDTIPGTQSDVAGAHFNFVVASCNGLPCGPYDPKKAITCSVCTK